MNTVRNYTTIHLQLNLIDVLEVVILLMTYLINYMFQIKQDLNVNVLNMITGINEQKTLTKDVSCKYKCKFDGRKCNSNQKWNNDKCRCECKKHHIPEKKIIFRILMHVVAKMVNIQRVLLMIQ